MNDSIKLLMSVVEDNPNLKHLLLETYIEMSVVVEPKKWFLGNDKVYYVFSNTTEQVGSLNSLYA